MKKINYTLSLKQIICIYTVCTIEYIYNSKIPRRYQRHVNTDSWNTVQPAAVETVDEHKILRAISISEFSPRRTQPLGSRKNGRENEGSWNYVDKHRTNMRCYWSCILSKKTILSDCCPHNQIQSEHDCEFFFHDVFDKVVLTAVQLLS